MEIGNGVVLTQESFEAYLDDLSAQKLKVKDLMQQVAARTHERDQLQKTLDILEPLLENATDKLASANSTISDLNDQITAKNTKIAKLQEDLFWEQEEHKHNVSELQDSLDDATANLNEFLAQTKEDFNEGGVKYNLIFDAGVASVDITTDNAAAIEEATASIQALEALSVLNDAKVKYSSLGDNTNDTSVMDSVQSVVQAAFDFGAQSVDITIDNKEAYDAGWDAFETTLSAGYTTNTSWEEYENPDLVIGEGPNSKHTSFALSDGSVFTIEHKFKSGVVDAYFDGIQAGTKLGEATGYNDAANAASAAVLADPSDATLTYENGVFTFNPGTPAPALIVAPAGASNANEAFDNHTPISVAAGNVEMHGQNGEDGYYTAPLAKHTPVSYTHLTLPTIPLV